MNAAVVEEVAWFAEHARAPRIRPILKWAEEELVIPEGRFEGAKYRSAELPWQRVWLSAIDDGRWRRFVLTACVQGGKTLCGFVMPVLWHLFEWREPFGAGLPTIDMSADKWRAELKPVIDAHPEWRALLPDEGRGSRGGKFESLTFKHGPTLKFLSSGGGDEKRSGLTLRGSAVTEADRLDTAGEASREAAPIYQIEARALSYEDDGRFYAECTSTTDKGFVAREQKSGTGTELYAEHAGCGQYVSPGREHLHGHEDAHSALEAKRAGVWACPACGEVIEDAERREMARRPVAVHRGQTIDKGGGVRGAAPETETFTLRVNCFWNLLWSTGFIAGEEWKAAGDKDQQSAERRARQWFWALPIEPDAFDVTPLEPEEILSAQVDLRRKGDVPAGTIRLAGAADVRKRQLHFVVVAGVVSESGVVTVHVVDAGVVPVESDKYGVRKGLRLALRELRDKRIEPGYRDAAGKLWRPGWFPCDAAWHAPEIRAFVRESQQLGIRRYLPSFGRGLSAENRRQRYVQPTQETMQKPHIGEEYYIAWHDRHALHALIANADHWKGQVRDGFKTPPTEPGAITLLEATTEDELKLLGQLAREIAAEKEQDKIVEGRGVVRVYVHEGRTSNHMGDALYNALAALHLAGVRIAEAQPLVAAAIARTEEGGRGKGEGGRGSVIGELLGERPYLVSHRAD